MKETDDTAAESKTGKCFRTENRENGGHFGAETERVPRVEDAGNVDLEMRTEEKLLKFCLFFVGATAAGK